MFRLKSVVFLIAGIILFTTLLFAVDKLYETVQQDKPISKNISNVVQNLKTTSQKALSNQIKPYLTDGFDWTLPAKTNVEPFSGLIDEYDSGIKFANNRFIILRWDEINPRQGVYDFSKFDNWLESITTKKAVVRLEVNSFCEAPKWALKQLRYSKNKSLVFWDKAYIYAIRPLIQTFAKKYAGNDQIVGVHLGIGDGEYSIDCNFDHKDGWGEFWMSPDELIEAQTNFGLTPDIFETSTFEIIDLYQNAFKQHKGKLAFTNLGALYSYGTKYAEAYNKNLHRISKYILKKGIGSRDGEIEIWLRYLDKIHGQKFISANDGTCKLEMDEAYADLVAGRYWGSENEFYGKKDYVIEEFGPYQNQAYRFLISSLRTLQMRRSYFSVSGEDFINMDDPIYQTQDFLSYLTKVMGKQKHNTPDVFILLGERYVNAGRTTNHSDEACVKGKQKIAIRSFGRWLSESSISTASVKINMPKNENYWGQDFYLAEGVDYEFSARTSNQFEFNLNDELSKLRCKTICDAEIKIVFKDSNKTTLYVRVAEGKSEPIQTLGDQKIKTATIRVQSQFTNSLKNGVERGTDFIIETGEKMLPIILVRMNLH